MTCLDHVFLLLEAIVLFKHENMAIVYFQHAAKHEPPILRSLLDVDDWLLMRMKRTEFDDALAAILRITHVKRGVPSPDGCQSSGRQGYPGAGLEDQLGLPLS